MKELFKNKNYTLLFTGSFVSEMGNVIFGFVAGLYVQDITDGKPIVLALFMALGAFVRLLFSPVAGVLVDRWDKVRIIYLTDFIRGLLFVVVAYVFFVGVDTNIAIIILLSVTVLSGIISAFFGPAVTSAIPEIVGLDHVQQANGANSIIQSSTMIVGVILGAAAFGLFPFHIALLINGVSFILSGISEMFIKALHRSEIPEHETPHMITDIKFGFNYLREKEGLLRLMIYSLFLNFAFSPLFSVGIPFLFRTELGRSEWEIAWLNIAFGIAMMVAGIVVGGMVLKSMSRAIRRSLVMLSGSFVFVSLIIYLLSKGIIEYPTFYVLMIVANISLAVFMISTNVPLSTSLVKVINPEVRGRVFSTIAAISGGAVPIAILLGGIVIELSSVAVLGIVCATLLMVPTFGFMTDKKVKGLFEGIEVEINGQLQETV
jgi:MFS family permease